MNSIDIISPADGSVVATRNLATEEEINSVIDRAISNQSIWQNTPIQQRINFCQLALDWFDQNRASIAKSISEQMGRPIQYAEGEINGLIERATYMMEIAEATLADTKIEDSSEFHRFIRLTPLGTCFIVAPWNYPFLTAINGLIAALLAGNTVILKHSAQTLLCAEMFASAFDSSGLPSGVFQILHIDHQQTAGVIKHKDIDYISFTGSVEGGAAVEQSATGLFKSIALELGGKDAGYVREDANVDIAAEHLADGAFFNSGQSCCGIERIYVHEQVYDQFLTAIIKEAKKLKLGPPLDPETTLGPMVNRKSANFARQQIRLAVEQGAKLHLDEADYPLSQSNSCFLGPQILTDVNHTMDIMNEESFAPIVGIMKVKDDKEALALINDSKYGLTASIWSKDEDAMIKLGNEIQVGTVFMNRCDYLDPALPWVGVKESGRGCSLSSLGFSQVTRPKSFHIRKD